jgi:hypothetical protein
VIFADSIKLREELALRIKFFYDRFDYEISHPSGIFNISRYANARKRASHVGISDLASLYALLQIIFDAREAAPHELFAHVLKHNIEPRLRSNLRNAMPHRPSAYDCDLVYLHPRFLNP